MRAFCLGFAALLLVQTGAQAAQGESPASLTLLDVPFISQSEALCGGAAAAMVLRYWGERGVTAESFAHLVDRSAAGIRTGELVADLRKRGWMAVPSAGDAEQARLQLSEGRPVLALIEDRRGTFHYVVVVAWHDRGVVFHDPARTPFRVMSASEFDRRWSAAGSWMAVIVPGSGAASERTAVDVPARDEAMTSCDQRIAKGVAEAQARQFDMAERTLTAALACPGSAALRELAGVRLLQERWPDVTDLASAAVSADPSDAYAWKLLATSRFVQGDAFGALEAWNHAQEPRLDLVRIDGLTRTRHRIAERAVGIGTGTVLSVPGLLRARRRLGELPSATATRLDYAPVASGLAELQGAVAERPLLPTDRIAAIGVGVSAGVRREVRLTTGSLTGGGEQLWGAWRFWPRRERWELGARAPSPWGGVWGAMGFSETNEFAAGLPPARRSGARVSLSDWPSAYLRLEAAAGLNRWQERGTLTTLGGGARYLSGADRLEALANLEGWFGSGQFGTVEASLRGRSRAGRRGTVVIATATVARATDGTPPELWFGGDVGHVRTALMRAHPLLDDGRLRIDRLGRTLMHATVETQRWWRAGGLLQTGVAAFADTSRVSRRLTGPAAAGLDVGAGLRAVVPGMPGELRLDVAKGLRDGATAVSLVYAP